MHATQLNPQLLREELQHADDILRFLHLHVCATLNVALKASRLDHLCLNDLYIVRLV
jgi:hypothetical protein